MYIVSVAGFHHHNNHKHLKIAIIQDGFLKLSAYFCQILFLHSYVLISFNGTFQLINMNFGIEFYWYFSCFKLTQKSQTT